MGFSTTPLARCALAQVVLDAHVAGSVQTAIGRAPDFFRLLATLGTRLDALEQVWLTPIRHSFPHSLTVLPPLSAMPYQLFAQLPFVAGSAPSHLSEKPCLWGEAGLVSGVIPHLQAQPATFERDKPGDGDQPK